MPALSYWEQQWARITRLLLNLQPRTRRGGARRKGRTRWRLPPKSLTIRQALERYGVPGQKVGDLADRELTVV